MMVIIWILKNHFSMHFDFSVNRSGSWVRTAHLNGGSCENLLGVNRTPTISDGRTQQVLAPKTNIIFPIHVTSWGLNLVSIFVDEQTSIKPRIEKTCQKFV